MKIFRKSAGKSGSVEKRDSHTHNSGKDIITVTLFRYLILTGIAFYDFVLYFLIHTNMLNMFTRGLTKEGSNQLLIQCTPRSLTC